MCVLFPKESPMLGFSFSLVVSGGGRARRGKHFRGRKMGVDGAIWIEMGGWTGVDGAVEGRWMLS